MSQDEAANQFRGYVEINELLQERIVAGDFSLSRYLENGGSYGLTSLLGTYSESDTNAKFRNGQPNSINMLLWYVALNGFAKDVALYVNANSGSPQFALRPEFAAALGPLAAWPASSAQNETTMFKFWLAISDYDLPEEEFAPWRDFFLRNYANRSAPDAISAMVISILYNPYFLLRS